MKKIIYSAWMGPGPMSDNRSAALLSIITNTGCLNGHVTLSSLNNWIHKDYPIHPAFQYLSAVHQCDYLRCYLLHVHGGGYTDIKNTTKDWSKYFDILNASDFYGMGYTEVGPHGVACVGGALEVEMKENYEKIIGVCAMIFKPQTKFTTEWFDSMHSLLDEKFNSVQLNPARHPQDRYGAEFTDGTLSSYPFAWTELGGSIFHPLAYKYNTNIIHVQISPSFSNYR